MKYPAYAKYKDSDVEWRHMERNNTVHNRIPVIDLSAGPGGLGEGFSAFRQDNRNIFKIRLSVEKDPHAHRTLELRAFFRQFLKGQAPEEYYVYLRTAIVRGGRAPKRRIGF